MLLPCAFEYKGFLCSQVVTEFGSDDIGTRDPWADAHGTFYRSPEESKGKAQSLGAEEFQREQDGTRNRIQPASEFILEVNQRRAHKTFSALESRRASAFRSQHDAMRCKL